MINIFLKYNVTKKNNNNLHLDIILSTKTINRPTKQSDKEILSVKKNPRNFREKGKSRKNTDYS